MAIKQERKTKIKNLIYERAYEIEQKLSEDNFLLAKLLGVGKEDVTNFALKVAIKELRVKIENIKELKN